MADIKVIREEEINEDTIEKEMQGVSELGYISLDGTFKKASIPVSNIKIASRASVTNNGYILPPYNPKTILSFKAMDSTYQACIGFKCDAYVGLGYKFGYKDIDKRDDIKRLFKNPNENISETITSLLKNMYADLDVFKNGYLEFVKSGKTRALYYLPAKDMYIKPKELNGYMLRGVGKYAMIQSDNSVIEYYPYPIDGKIKDDVHYVIHFREGSQEDIYYGKPDTQHLHELISTSYLCQQYNKNFFSNGGQPAWALLVTGGKLTKKAQSDLKKFIETNLKGVANAHKMLFLSFPSEKAQAKLVPLSKSIDEQFIKLDESIQYRIALNRRVHPKLLGLYTGGNFGGGSAGTADLKLNLESVCTPAQNYVEEIINKFLYSEFGVECEFNLEMMNISNEKDLMAIASLGFNMRDEFGNRVLGINEIREKYLKLKPIELMTEIFPDPSANTRKPVNSDGDNRFDEGQADGEQQENLDPDKNIH